MSDLTVSSAEPAYINRLALTHPPFTQLTADDAFYDGSHIKQRRLLIQHLLRATTTPILLLADQGMGKTTLLAQLQRQAPPDIHYCVLPLSDDKLTICQAVLADLQIESSHDMASCEAELKQRLVQLRRVNIVPVLLVEDIEARSEAIRTMLADWLRWQNEEQLPLWQAIMTAAQSEPALGTEQAVQKLDMPALEAQEVETYLMQRLQGAGYKGDIPFTDRELHRFYRLSGGNPGKINQLAHQQLLGTASSTTWRFPWTLDFKQAGRWSVLLVLGLMIVTALIFQQEINSWINKSESPVEEEISLPSLERDQDIATVVVGETATPAEDDPIQELATLLAEMPSAGQAVSDTDTDTDTLVNSNKTKRPDVQQVETAVSQEALETPVKAQSTDSDNTSKDSEPPRRQIHDKTWILQQKPSHYTFQLMGAWDAGEVDEFIDKYALAGDVATFTSLRDNKPWHVLVYGVYPTRQAALSASNRWVAPLDSVPTWLRRFDSVQKQIREKGVKP
ncbi:MAG: SPOR domain-containing protein [Methylophaga sp.]